MIADLKPYPEYKESGLPWLGQVPGHWRVVRNGSLFAQRNQTDYADLPILEVSLKTGVRVRDFEKSTRKQVMSDIGKYKRAAKGDLAYNMMRMWQGAVGVAPVDGLVSPAYVVARPYPGVEPQFLADLFRTGAYMTEVDNVSRGIVKDRNRLYWDQFKQMLSPSPPHSEQAAIVRLLGWANGRLERAIRAKQKVIALLTEQKQAIIHRAVTRGLDPSVPFKSSGIPWLGDIPHHWKVLRAKYLYREVDERSADGSEELLSVSHLTGVTPRSQKNITMFKAASYADHKLCRPGDLVVNTMWAWMGALGVSTHAGIISPAYAVYRPHRPEHIVGAYMDGLLRSRPYVSNMICRSTGLRASRLRLYPDEFFRLPIIQPPSEEQQRIVQTILGDTADLNTAVSRLEREIELLREYRTRLVADVVTGKLDVRAAAARLPEEAKPDTAEDDTDLSDETEPADEEAAA